MPSTTWTEALQRTRSPRITISDADPPHPELVSLLLQAQIPFANFREFCITLVLTAFRRLDPSGDESLDETQLGPVTRSFENTSPEKILRAAYQLLPSGATKGGSPEQRRYGWRVSIGEFPAFVFVACAKPGESAAVTLKGLRSLVTASALKAASSKKTAPTTAGGSGGSSTGEPSLAKQEEQATSIDVIEQARTEEFCSPQQQALARRVSGIPRDGDGDVPAPTPALFPKSSTTAWGMIALQKALHGYMKAIAGTDHAFLLDDVCVTDDMCGSKAFEAINDYMAPKNDETKREVKADYDDQKLASNLPIYRNGDLQRLLDSLL